MFIGFGWTTFLTVAKVAGGILTKLGSLSLEDEETIVINDVGDLKVEYYKETGETIVRNPTDKLINFYITQRNGADGKLTQVMLALEAMGKYNATEHFKEYSNGEITISPSNASSESLYETNRLYTICMAIDTWKEKELSINKYTKIASGEKGFLIESQNYFAEANLSLTDTKKGRVRGKFQEPFKYNQYMKKSSLPSIDYPWVEDYWYAWMPQPGGIMAEIPYDTVMVNLDLPMNSYLEMMDGGYYDVMGNNIRDKKLQQLKNEELKNIEGVDIFETIQWSDARAYEIVQLVGSGEKAPQQINININEKNLSTELYQLLFEDKQEGFGNNPPNKKIPKEVLIELIRKPRLVLGLGVLGVIAFAIYKGYSVEMEGTVMGNPLSLKIRR